MSHSDRINDENQHLWSNLPAFLVGRRWGGERILAVCLIAVCATIAVLSEGGLQGRSAVAAGKLAETGSVSPAKLIGYLEDQLRQFPEYHALRFEPIGCVSDLCTFNLKPGVGYVQVATKNDLVEGIRIISPLADQNDFSTETRALFFVFTIIIWQQLAATASYADADRLLRDLLYNPESNSAPGAAVISAGKWTFGAVSIKCQGAAIMLMGGPSLSSTYARLLQLPATCNS